MKGLGDAHGSRSGSRRGRAGIPPVSALAALAALAPALAAGAAGCRCAGPMEAVSLASVRAAGVGLRALAAAGCARAFSAGAADLSPRRRP